LSGTTSGVLPRTTRYLGAYNLGQYLGERRLAFDRGSPKLARMKLLWATVLHLVVVGVIGAGILLLMQGKPALLVVSTLVYFALLGKVGCASH
jgi:uncharacterized membrane protein YoaK (UPF0700 family)